MFGSKVAVNSGAEVEILDPGVHNVDSGPDFSSARIRSGGVEWAGNVEIHVKASDWNHHGHNTDPAYDTVILHVVGIDDAEVTRTDGTRILQACVAPPKEFYDRYAILTGKIDTPNCMAWIGSIPSLNLTDWVESLGVERIQEKAGYMKSLLDNCKGDWHTTLFILLSRALGFGLNGVPFELLAKSIPLNYAMRHKDHILQLEALLFGQSGMLEPGLYHYDEYYVALCREYGFLKTKYGLTPLKGDIWKYSRTRPGNFPHRRIAILASMLAQGMQFYGRLMESKGDYDLLMELLDVEASDYWHFHSRFGDAVHDDPLPVRLSKSSREIVLINVAAPFYYAYGSLHGDPDIAEKGLDLLRTIGSEKNSIVSLWTRHGLKADSAFHSQALIQLHRNYCLKSRCLECRFGHWILRRATN